MDFGFERFDTGFSDFDVDVEEVVENVDLLEFDGENLRFQIICQQQV